MTASRYFVAAAILLLLGAAAMPVGLTAYAIAGTSRELTAVAVGVWAIFVLVIAVAGPVVLLVAGIASLLTGRDG